LTRLPDPFHTSAPPVVPATPSHASAPDSDNRVSAPATRELGSLSLAAQQALDCQLAMMHGTDRELTLPGLLRSQHSRPVADQRGYEVAARVRFGTGRWHP
jgi:hypothetical protein